MSENQEFNKSQNVDNDGTNTASQGTNVGQDLVDQIGRLGNTIAEVAQAAWNSEERQQIQHDLKSGLSTLATGIEDGLRKVSESEEAKGVLNKAEEVVESITNSEKVNAFTQELTNGLMGGLEALNQQMGSWSDELKKRTGSNNPAKSDVVQEIKIEISDEEQDR